MVPVRKKRGILRRRFHKLEKIDRRFRRLERKRQKNVQRFRHCKKTAGSPKVFSEYKIDNKSGRRQGETKKKRRCKSLKSRRETAKLNRTLRRRRKR